MSEHVAEGAVAAAVNNVVENLSKLPASTSSHAVGKSSHGRLFNREKTVHELLGGGKGRITPPRGKAMGFTHQGHAVASEPGVFPFVEQGVFGKCTPRLSWCSSVALVSWVSADVLLWKHKPLSGGVLAGATIAWILFEWSGYTLLSLVSNVVAGLWVLSVIGGWFNFLTLAYIGVVASHTVPALYEKYEDEVDKYGKVAVEQANVQYKKIDALLLSKIPRAAPKDKKSQ
ncbi:hypothetical protein Mapa_003405 [Marchantia paleacea]|nr:hypothetical protein Mapa_003405 [Marchantia paleacea]